MGGTGSWTGSSPDAIYSLAEVYDPSAGTWSTAAPMQTARFGHAVVTGSNGLIYAIGGHDQSNFLTSVEAYDPSVGAWHYAPSLSTARYVLAAAVGSDGRIYALGGDSGGGAFNSVEALTPGASSWTAVAPMNQARHYFSAATGADGRLYAVSGDSTQETVEAYSPTSGSWTMVASLSMIRYGVAAVEGLDGLLYALSGNQLSSQYTTSVEAYRPSAGSWSLQPASMLTARYLFGSAVGLDGTIYAVGGRYLDQTLDAVEAYSPGCVPDGGSANASAPDAGPLAPMPTPRAYTGAALGPDGRIYVVGGVGDGGYFVATAEAYDPAANQWTELAPMPSPTSNMGATFGPDGLLYAVGGLVGISVGCGTPGPYYESSQVEAYDPATDQWVSKPSMANARNYPGVVTGPDGRIYAAGGWSGGANLANAEAYDVDAGTWKPIASMSTGRTVAGYAVGLGAGGLFYMLGGQNGGPPLYTAEAYSSETNAWTGLTSLPGSGQCFGWGIEGAAVGPDGRLYAIGVCTGTTNSSMFSYDPSSGYNGSWSGAASVPAGVYQGFGVATKPGPNGRIYVFGGMNSASSNCSVNANVVAYDPASGTWSNWAP